MRRALMIGLTSVLSVTGCGAPAADAASSVAQEDHGDPDAAAIIADAMRAAPASISAGATIMDHEGNVIREGSNGWVCLPDMGHVPNDFPMCLDDPWLETIDAWMNQRTPEIDRTGIGYMLQGDMPVSNVDPFAEGPTPDNQWVQNSGPHIMLVFPDARVLDGLPTDPENGGPWVMWKGTPYAHLMLPAPRLER